MRSAPLLKLLKALEQRHRRLGCPLLLVAVGRARGRAVRVRPRRQVSAAAERERARERRGRTDGGARRPVEQHGGAVVCAAGVWPLREVVDEAPVLQELVHSHDGGHVE